MTSWLDRPGSLNWANRKKLNIQIKELEETLSLVKSSLLSLLSVVNLWGYDTKELLELGGKNQLTAMHILHLRPLLERIKNLKAGLDELNELCQDELLQMNEHNSTPKF